jgi:hypothetical protein
LHAGGCDHAAPDPRRRADFECDQDPDDRKRNRDHRIQQRQRAVTEDAESLPAQQHTEDEERRGLDATRPPTASRVRRGVYRVSGIRRPAEAIELQVERVVGFGRRTLCAELTRHGPTTTTR